MKMKLLTRLGRKALEIGGVVGTVREAEATPITHRKKRASITVIVVGLLVDLGLDGGIAEALVNLLVAAMATQGGP